MFDFKKIIYVFFGIFLMSSISQAAFNVRSSGSGKFNGDVIVTISDACLTLGFPATSDASALCAEHSAGTYDADCTSWGQDQSPVISDALCSMLTYQQYTDFKSDRAMATTQISGGGNGFSSYTEQSNYLSNYINQTQANYANLFGYTSSENTDFDNAVNATSAYQGQCALATDPPDAVCAAALSNCACIDKADYDAIATSVGAVQDVLTAASTSPHTLTSNLVTAVTGLDVSDVDLTVSTSLDYLAGKFAALDASSTAAAADLQASVDALETQIININAVLTAAAASPHTLTAQLINNVEGLSTSGLDLTDSTSLEYMASLISALDAATVDSAAELQTSVSAATKQVSAKWKIAQIAISGDENPHPLSSLTTTLYDNAVNTSGFLADILAANPDYTITNLRTNLASYFSANSITATSSDDAFKLFPVSQVGFSDGITSYNAWLANDGFSIDTINDATVNVVQLWEACRRSRDDYDDYGGTGACATTVSGGAGICSSNYSAWTAKASDCAAKKVYQVHHNDMSGPRVRLETVLGERLVIRNVATRDVTQFRYDRDGTTRTSTFGWMSSTTTNPLGSYAFFAGETTTAYTGSLIDNITD